jgi:hypothetical protein
MHTTDLSAVALPKADVPLSAEERLQEVAAVLAAGLLRLRTRPQLVPTSDMPDGHVPTLESAESAQKALGLSATARPDPHAG